MAPLGWNGLVFDAQAGDVLHEIDTGAPIGAGIIAYELDGRQYVAVAGGSISPIEPATSRVTIPGVR